MRMGGNGRLWPIATGGILTARRPFQSIADIDRFSLCNDVKRLTHSGDSPLSIDAVRKVRSPRMLAVSENAEFVERNVVECRAARVVGLLQLDACDSDHLGPFVGVVGDEPSEVGG
jgi:hypothetical protein